VISRLITLVQDKCRSHVGLFKKQSEVFNFIHIPKTAGSSLRKALDEEFSGRGVFDYGENAKETHSLIKRFNYDIQDKFELSQRIKNMGKVVIGGHVYCSQYCGIASLNNTATIIRQPFERIKSHYKHAKVKQNFQGSFREFIMEPKNQNLQTKYLNYIPIQAIGTVGLTNSFSKSIELMNERWSTALIEYKENLADNSFFDESTTDLEEEKQLFERLNKLDFDLFNSAEMIFRNSCYFKEQCLPDKRAFCSMEQSSGIINGWGFAYGDEAPLLIKVVLVDNEEEHDIKCIQFRPFLNGIGAPRDGYIGFELPTDNYKGEIKIIDPISEMELFSTKGTLNS